MIHIDYLIDDETGRRDKYLVSDARLEVLSLTKEGEANPSRFAIKLTDEMEDAIIQGWEA